MRALLVLALCVGAAAAVQATAVVVFRTDERIVLAADSQIISKDKTGAQTSALACKIRPAGRWWTVVGGFMGAETPLHDRIVRALTPARTFADVKTTLSTSLSAAMREDLQRASTSKAFTMFEHGHVISQLVVAGSNPDDPTLRLGALFTTLTHVSPLELSTQWHECPAPACVGGRVWIGAGQDGPVRTLLRQPRAAWVDRADAAAARRIITQQIAYPHSEASAPIDTLELTTSGARWVDRDARSLCASGVSETRP